jgi:hypothetical protein
VEYRKATIPLFRRSVTHLADLLRAHRTRRGTRYRRLGPAGQALLVLAHLRNGDTPARLAGDFHISLTTAWRYIREAVDLLAATAPTVTQAMPGIGRLAYAILDGTLIRTDRLSGANDRRYYAGKHRCHGVNAQVIADPVGRQKWISQGLPGHAVQLHVRGRPGSPARPRLASGHGRPGGGPWVAAICSAIWAASTADAADTASALPVGIPALIALVV